LVSSHLGLGNLDEARAVLHKVLTLEPENSWASDRLDEIGGHFTGTRVLELERWFISPATEALLTEWPSEPTGPQIVAVTLSDPPDADPAEKPESRTGLDSEYLPPPVMVTLGPQKSTVFPRDLTVIGDSTVRSQDSDRDMLVETALLTLGASPKGDRKNPEKILETIELISLSKSVEVHGIPLSKSVPVFEPPPDRPVSEKPVVTAAGEVTSDPNEDELGLPAETTPRKLAERPRQNVLVSQAISVIPSLDDLGLGSGWEDQLSLVDTLPSSAENMIHVSGLASSSSLVALPVSDDQLKRSNESGMIQKAELIGSPTFIGGLVCAVVVVSVFGLLAGMGTMTLLGGLLAAAAVFVLVCWCAGSGTDVEPADIRRGRI
ncbi:MAG: hypothetical protein JSU96_07965, partial [Acidobacteriota bacterium]